MQRRADERRGHRHDGEHREPDAAEGSTLRLSMWSGPRNVSTALMYSFRQRNDTSVVDEPFYGHYLRLTGADHPGAAMVMAAMECNAERVTREVILGPARSKVVFFKNMAHHLRGIELGSLDGVIHALLIRDPAEMIPSLARVLKNPTLDDTGLPEQCLVLEHVLARGCAPLVLDSRELLTDPRTVLDLACRRLGLEFDEAMLSWPAGAKPEDGCWAPHWYASVHSSTGFAPYREKREVVSDELQALIDECRPYYERLQGFAVRAKSDANSGQLPVEG